jgi:hypothetical protein
VTPFLDRNFFASRTLYYPGSETDGHPIHYFGEAHAIHCFVYADYHYAESDVIERLSDPSHPEHPKGYQLVERRHLEKSEITPHGFIPHLPPPAPDDDLAWQQPEGGPFAQWAVMERLPEYGEKHGPARWSVLHIGGEGVATFDALFCQRDQKLPYAILLQDQGYGGQWIYFGGEDSPLWKLIRMTDRRPPEWLLAGNYTPVWPGHEMVREALGPDPSARSLYKFGG